MRKSQGSACTESTSSEALHVPSIQNEKSQGSVCTESTSSERACAKYTE